MAVIRVNGPITLSWAWHGVMFSTTLGDVKLFTGSPAPWPPVYAYALLRDGSRVYLPA